MVVEAPTTTAHTLQKSAEVIMWQVMENYANNDLVDYRDFLVLLQSCRKIMEISDRIITKEIAQ